MIFARIGRDRALRFISLWGIAAGVNTSLMAGLVLWHSVRQSGAIPTPLLVLVGWIGVAIYLAFGHVRTRCSDLDLSLPIPTRTIWLAHLLAVLAGGAVVVVISFVALALNWMLLAEAPPIRPGLATFGALLSAGFVLATLLTQVPQRSLARIPVTPAYVAWIAGVLIGVPVLIAVASLAGLTGALLIALLAVAVGTWLYRTVPPAFAVVPLKSGPADREVDAGEIAREGRRSRFALPLTVAGSVSSGVQELFVIPLLVIFGMILGGGLNAINVDALREMQFLYIPMGVYMLFVVIGPRLGRLHHVDPLPIPRSVLCGTLFVPYLLLSCAGYGLGLIAASRATSQIEYVNFQMTDSRCDSKPDCDFEVTVPLRVYAVAWDGNPQAVGTTWGESHQPKPLTPWRWGQATVYSPYSTPPGSSLAFVAFQIHRAVEDVYGVTIPPEDIAESYLVEQEDGRVIGKGDELTLRADYPQLRPRSGPLFPALIALTAAPWLLLVAVLLRAYRAGINEWVRQTVFWGSTACLLLFWLALSFGTIAGVVKPWTVRGSIEIPVMLLGRSVVGVFAVWVVSTLAIAGAYWVTQRQFRHMEIPATPSKYSLLDRMRVEA